MWAIDRPGAKGFWRGNRAPKLALLAHCADRRRSRTVIGGRQDQFIGRIQGRYGAAKDEAERQVKTSVNRM
jgi:hypothetical protein